MSKVIQLCVGVLWLASLPLTAAGEKTTKTIIGIVSSDDRFTTLVTALKEAELVAVLQGEGPFTLFAPADSAFAKLPEEAVDELLKPENKAELQRLLKYHVVSGRVTTAEIKPGPLATVSGDEIDITVDESGVVVGGARVAEANICAVNGVIHVIDGVLLPRQPISSGLGQP